MRPLFISAFFALVVLTGCRSGQNFQDQTNAGVKVYHVRGKVVSTDAPHAIVVLDHEAIPDFMEAMTMPYQVKPERELDKLSPGDMITADVVVQDDNGWLENIVITRHAGAAEKAK